MQGVRTKQAIADLMQSPQFHQQLDSFTQVSFRDTYVNLSYSSLPGKVPLLKGSTEVRRQYWYALLISIDLQTFCAGDSKWSDRFIAVRD